MSRPKVSVIIPVYGVEKYIEKCAKSLFEQTLDDIEYIFINDCTPDASIRLLKNVLEDYPERKGLVRIIDMVHNSGQAAARNKGLELVSGEYVIHCDSDDYIDNDMYRAMWQTAIDTSSDMVLCGIDEYTPYGKHICHTDFDEHTDLLGHILSTQWGGSLCNKLVKSSIVKNKSIVLPDNNFWEDLALSVQYALNCKNCSYIMQGLYKYCRRTDSIIGSSNFDIKKSIEHTVQASKNYEIVVNAIQQCGYGPKYEQYTIRKQLYIKNQLLPLMPFKECTSLWKSLCGNNNWKILTSNHISLRERITFTCTYCGIYTIWAKIKPFLTH